MANAAGLNSFYTRLRNYISSNKEYSFSRIVNVEVIGLGTNDMAQVTSGTARQTNYVNLMNTVRSKNPDVPIVIYRK